MAIDNDYSNKAMRTDIPSPGGQPQPQMQMPQYQCHKKVWALKIKEIRPIGNGTTEKYGAYIFPEEPHFSPIQIDEEFFSKHNPAVGGYLVQYEDGYRSYSPQEAFEGGYTAINPIDPLFRSHYLDLAGVQKVDAVRYHFNILLANLRRLCPEPTREFSVVKTKLEEASFFAVKSISAHQND